MATSSSSRYDKLQARYDLLTSKVASGESILPDTSYADFLKLVAIISLATQSVLQVLCHIPVPGTQDS